VLDGQIPPRPMTHDLLMTIVNHLGGKVIRVVIDEIIDNTFYAKLSLRKDEEIIVIDARPSDSIALALRAGAPIFVASKVFDEAGIYMKEGELPGESALEEKEEAPEEDVRTPLQILEDSLEAAIKAEDYENAARIRDQIKKIVESS
ncbi:MAG: bifunctional nuclease family protein, partial [Leptospiraceae bacterium]|nr:bifunctional nuclease family protein [Leptospiraceae bacterium]